MDDMIEMFNDFDNVEDVSIEEIATAVLPSKKEVDKDSLSNYLINRENLATDNKTRYADNIEAIKLLKEIEKRDGLATSKEQSILAKYVGWGGLADSFKEGTLHYKELTKLLTSEELSSARTSVLDSFYTPAVIIKFIYKVLQRMGFTKGKILDPSVGSGRFISFMPQDIFYNSKVDAVEIDNITYRICKQLHQNTNIFYCGFQDTNFENEMYDLIISNIPFGNSTPYDKQNKELNKHNYLIHDYFFAKAIKKLKNKGILAFVTSTGTLDKRDNKLRQFLFTHCNLLGAVRLPSSTFDDTEVCTDIIFLQKDEYRKVIDYNWVDIDDENMIGEILVNEYYSKNRHMMLGKMEIISGRFGPTQVLIGDKPTSKELDKLVKYFPSNIYISPIDDSYMYDKDELIICTNELLREGEFCFNGDDIFQRQGDFLVPCEWPTSRKNRLAGYIKIKNLFIQLNNAQLKNCTDFELKNIQNRLNELYDEFIIEYGYINSKDNRKILREDTLYDTISGLELYDSNLDKYDKSNIFYERTIGITSKEVKPETIEDALMISFTNLGKMDLNFMANSLKKTVEDVIKELKEKVLIFYNPATNLYEYREDYLTGFVKDKLSQAEEACKTDPNLEINVIELRNNQPEYVSDVYFNFSSTWIPNSYKEDFVKETLEISDFELIYTNECGYNVKVYEMPQRVQNRIEWGTDRISAIELIEIILNQKDPVVNDSKWDDAKQKNVQVKNHEQTTLAMNIADRWRMAFNDYVTSNLEVNKILLDIYNAKFVNYKPREYMNVLTNLKINPNFRPRDYQLRAASRIIMSNQNVLLWHSVGTGKTATMIISAMEMSRMSKIGSNRGNKNLFVIPNSLCASGQFARDFINIYPYANILSTTSDDFKPANRRKIIAKMVTCNWDAIIIPHSVLERIPLKPETEKQLINDDINELRRVLEFYRNEKGVSDSVKKIEDKIKKLYSKLDELNDSNRDLGLLYWEDLGVDMLYVDEAHNYKNLHFPTKLQVSGVSSTDAKKTQDLYNKIRYQRRIKGNKGIVFATATPISNSMCEMYTMMKYLGQNVLEKYEVDNFDAWASVYGEIVTGMEADITGNGFRFNRRFSKFNNIPELVTMYKQVTDIVNVKDVEAQGMIKLPKLKTGKPIVVEVQKTNDMTDFVDDLVDRAAEIRSNNPRSFENKNGVVGEDNMLRVTTHGRLMAVSPLLVGLEESLTPKSDALCENVYRIYSERPGAQLIFCDLGTPKDDGSYSVYDEIADKLIDMGVMEKDIAFIHDANTVAKRKALIDNVNNGVMRVLIGSSSKMGEGTNFQSNLVALHHFDVPWKPALIEQREGRIIRHGNTNEEVEIYRYVVKGTFDVYSWQVVEIKAKYIYQIMSGASTARSVDEISDMVFSYAETKACACGDERIMKVCQLSHEIQKLQLLEKAYRNRRISILNSIKSKENVIIKYRDLINDLRTDIDTFKMNQSENFYIYLGETCYDRSEMPEVIKKLYDMIQLDVPGVWGNIYGLKIEYRKRLDYNKQRYNGSDVVVRELSIGEYYSLTSPYKRSAKILLEYILGYIDKSFYKLEELKDTKHKTEVDVLGMKNSINEQFKDTERLKVLKKEKSELENELNIGNTKSSS